MSPLPPSLSASDAAYTGKPVKPPVLYKWTIFPVIAVIVIDIFYGRPQARMITGDSDRAVPYLVGTILGSILIPLLFAWGFYRLFRRSTKAGTTTFILILTLLCCSTIYTSQTEFTFPAAGFTVTSPPGWFHVRSTQPEIVVSWIAPGSLAIRGHINGIIFIHATAANPVIEGGRSAQMVADSWNGQITNDHETIDGERAWHMQGGAPPNTSSQDLPPSEVLITIHKQRLYAIECDAIPGTFYHDQVDFVRDHWKWLPP